MRLPVGFLLLLVVVGVAWLCVAIVEVVVAVAAIVARGVGGPLARAQVGAALRRARRAGGSWGFALLREAFRRRQVVVRRGLRPRLLFLLGRMPRAGRDGSWVVLERLAALRDFAELEVVALSEGLERDEVADCEALGIPTRPIPRHTGPWRSAAGSSDPVRLVRDYSDPSIRGRVAEQLAGAAWDSIVVEYAEMAFVASDLLAGLPAVYVCHESLVAAELASPRPDDPAWRERLGRSICFERRMLDRHRTIALSSADAAVLGAVGKRAPAVVPSAVRPMRSQPDPGCGDLVLFVGNFAHPPNVDAVRWLLAEIWPRVRRLAPGAELAIVGRHAVPASPADGVVQFGPADDLQPWFQQAAVVIAPLRTGAGLRGKLLEAWARGKAVVASPQAAAGFAARPDTDYLSAADADAFADAVVACLSDASLRLRLGSAALQYVRDQHDPVPLARRFLDLVLAAPAPVGRVE